MEEKPEKVMEDYITIPEGIYKGVAYRIRSIQYVERDGGHYAEFDYDVKGLDENKYKEFEDFLGNFLLEAIKKGIEEDKRSDGNGF